MIMFSITIQQEYIAAHTVDKSLIHTRDEIEEKRPDS
jgi:hypothetical protein